MERILKSPDERISPAWWVQSLFLISFNTFVYSRGIWIKETVTGTSTAEQLELCSLDWSAILDGDISNFLILFRWNKWFQYFNEMTYYVFCFLWHIISSGPWKDLEVSGWKNFTSMVSTKTFSHFIQHICLQSGDLDQWNSYWHINSRAIRAVFSGLECQFKWEYF